MSRMPRPMTYPHAILAKAYLASPVEVRREDAGRHPPVAARRPFFARLSAMPVTTELVCSARACRNTATWALRWNNPRLHTPERRKTWLACDSDLESLTGFLQLRGFLCETVPVEQLPAPDPPPARLPTEPR
jgi:hypothetical protein